MCKGVRGEKKEKYCGRCTMALVDPPVVHLNGNIDILVCVHCHHDTRPAHYVCVVLHRYHSSPASQINLQIDKVCLECAGLNV